MEHLKSMGKVIFIDVPFKEIERRVTNIKTRGIVFHPNETLADVYRGRKPLYERYADITVSVMPDNTIEDTVESLTEIISDIY